jgi:hypothetical protein
MLLHKTSDVHRCKVRPVERQRFGIRAAPSTRETLRLISTSGFLYQQNETRKARTSPSGLK